MGSPIIVDTGPLFAIASRIDDYHDACVTWLGTVSMRELVVPSLVITEVCQLIEKRVGPEAEAKFVDGFSQASQFKVWDPEKSDFRRMAGLVRKYADWPLGVADTAVVVAAEKLKVIDVATVDRNHFSMIRPSHASYFRLHPETL